MTFQERTTENGYSYDVEDVFGTIHLDSSSKLSPELLDDIVVTLLRNKVAAKTVEGEVEHSTGKISYQFHRRPTWEEPDEDEDVCADTPTGTNELASTSIPIIDLIVKIWNWCRKFAAAFRAAWKNIKD